MGPQRVSGAGTRGVTPLHADVQGIYGQDQPVRGRLQDNGNFYRNVFEDFSLYWIDYEVGCRSQNKTIVAGLTQEKQRTTKHKGILSSKEMDTTRKAMGFCLDRV